MNFVFLSMDDILDSIEDWLVLGMDLNIGFNRVSKLNRWIELFIPNRLLNWQSIGET